MPKAVPSSTTNRPTLRRNQACRECRKRKLKCDAARPHCGTCVKHWQAMVRVPAPIDLAYPNEPTCTYDPIEGLTLADVNPAHKIAQLEAEISALKCKLLEKDGQNSATNGQLAFPNLDTCPGAPPGASSSKGSPSVDSPPSNAKTSSVASTGSPDPLMDLLFYGFNPDLPDQQTLLHYVDVFFKCDPCGSRILHKPSIMVALQLPPRDPGYPHPALLHAICASASRWSPQEGQVTVLPDGTRRDRFAEFHAAQTRRYVDKTMANGEDIFAVMQACILLCWYFYQEGRWVEVWIFAAFQIRVAIPLRLNYPGTFSTHGNNSPGAYLAPPQNFHDLELRRRTWWMTAIVLDRIASVGGWIHAIDERDIGTELPLRRDSFESTDAIASNPQDLMTPNLYTQHPPLYTDSTILFIKAVMMFGRITDFTVRGNLRSPTAPSNHQDPFFLDGFSELDQLVSRDFTENLPHIYRVNHGLGDGVDGSTLDTDLYMVHIIPHAATITLHNPYVNFAESSCVSSTRCVHAARSILAAYHELAATSLDITRLHPFVTICWYLAAVIEVQLCKYFLDNGDSGREATVWAEINTLRFALLEYGKRSPIGIRQERLLQGLMKEIVRLTSHKQPLEVGMPLYPFSHATAFRKDEQGVDNPDGVVLPAPLNVGSPYSNALDGYAFLESSDLPIDPAAVDFALGWSVDPTPAP
ncbi:hypothetical protein FISHEDRAFT_46184 [Fistulina hepatica ATCC 64428]|uniref:Zn(2)-C6 fungal-type domain-containing protein n=1 Tax=Fistulina hepatica ATCC 64428 TaxID=1128425 RepID=A0A0D7A7Q9_9AGAR|nr:hypothetical protein FISHEDRAFT_46184 [Fistulina hepatica ATCC 64428]